MTKCQHCHHGNATRPRGLCHGCYVRPSVRKKFPSVVNRGHAVDNFAGRKPEPTRHRPGTPEKVAVLEEWGPILLERFKEKAADSFRVLQQSVAFAARDWIAKQCG